MGKRSKDFKKGNLDITSIQSNLGFSKDDILLATHPAYGQKGDVKLMKRRFIFVEHIHADRSRETRVGALGGHFFWKSPFQCCYH